MSTPTGQIRAEHQARALVDAARNRGGTTVREIVHEIDNSDLVQRVESLEQCVVVASEAITAQASRILELETQQYRMLEMVLEFTEAAKRRKGVA